METLKYKQYFQDQHLQVGSVQAKDCQGDRDQGGHLVDRVAPSSKLFKTICTRRRAAPRMMMAMMWYLPM